MKLPPECLSYFVKYPTHSNGELFRKCLSHVERWLYTMQYGSIDIECMHLHCHLLDNNDESLMNNGIYPVGFHIWCKSPLLVTKGSSIIIWRNYSQSAYLLSKNYSHIPGNMVSSMDSLCHFLNKKGEYFGNVEYLQLGPSYVIQIGSYIIVWWNSSVKAHLIL